ncbi:MAG TPA: hypothetical protein VHU89_08165 [Acidobacteriaceae bacterium]|jgi:hypothetical protein|nr:hypothetical protein [Acidobacteriaceae bacterium]
MDLKAFEHDLASDAEHPCADARNLFTTFVPDARAEAEHRVDSTQRESMIERHLGFLLAVMAIFMIIYFGGIVFILRLPAQR